MGKLTDKHLDFLKILAAHNTAPVTRALLPLADREQDKVRQDCKRMGLAEFVGGWRGKHRIPSGWQITPAGRAALKERSNETH